MRTSWLIRHWERACLIRQMRAEGYDDDAIIAALIERGLA